MAARTSGDRPRRRWKRWAALAAGVVLLVAGAWVAWSVMRVQAVPEHWEEHRAFIERTPALDLERLSRALELDVPRAWTRPVGEGDGVRTVRLPLDQVNAWLAVRLEDYLANQGRSLPEGLGGVMLAGRDGKLVAAAEYTGGPASQIISATFAAEPVREDEGPAAVRLEGVAAGRQPLPSRWLADRIAGMDIESEPLREALETIAAGEAIRPVTLPVDAYREAELLGVDVTPEAVELTVRVRYVGGE